MKKKDKDHQDLKKQMDVKNEMLNKLRTEVAELSLLINNDKFKSIKLMEVQPYFIDSFYFCFLLFKIKIKKPYSAICVEIFWNILNFWLAERLEENEGWLPGFKERAFVQVRGKNAAGNRTPTIQDDSWKTHTRVQQSAEQRRWASLSSERESVV